MVSEAAANFRTVDRVLKTRISNSIHSIIKAARENVGSATINIAAFVDAARQTKPVIGAQSVVRTIFADKEFPIGGPSLEASAGEGVLTDGLAEAFADALAIRSRVKGRDKFIGLRHVLFAIFTNPADTTLAEVAWLFRTTEIDPASATKEICGYVDRHMEEEEDRQVWAEIFRERGLLPLESKGGSLNDTTLSSQASKTAPDPQFTPRPNTGPEVALPRSDDPWSEDAVDRSGAQVEADAFAAMISARQFVPPLAIGIFGEWGSGKSFFMRLVYNAIEGRKLGEAGKPADPNLDVSLLDHVVQIRFNAWHYAETNLWASLVDHIFTSLDRWAEKENRRENADKVFERLATARQLTIESAQALIQARRERDDARDKFDKASKTLVQKQEELAKKPATWISTAFQAIVQKSDTAQTDLKGAAKLLGLGDVTASVAELQAAGSSLDDAVASFGLIRSATLRWLSLPLVIFVVTALVALLPPLLAWGAQFIDTRISPIAAAVSGALAPLVAVIGVAAKKARDAAEKLRGFHAELQAKVAELAAAEQEDLARAQKELDEAQVKATQAASHLQAASEEAAQAASDYNLRSGKGRVLRFVRERVATGDYARHLGFTAAVRKDFEELSVLMSPSEDAKLAEAARAAHARQIESVIETAGDLLEETEQTKLRDSVKAPDDNLKVFERIVLYVDDLDRCPPKQVVEVLQAIHLLLTFPLFVVLVAVDVRWVREALVTHYPGQIGYGQIGNGQAGKGQAGNIAASPATAGDYLEKIFQIPYWVRAMTAANTQALLADQLGSEPDDEAPSKEAAAEGATAVRQEEAVLASVAAADGAQAGTGPGRSTPLPDSERRLRSLHISSGERTFMMEVAGVLAHSPRRTLRFVNSYRLIKASLAAREVAHLEAGGYEALMTLLAIGVCAGDGGRALMASLRGGTVPLHGSKPANGDPEALRLWDARQLYEKGKRRAGGKGDLLLYAPVVSRFSFEDR